MRLIIVAEYAAPHNVYINQICMNNGFYCLFSISDECRQY